MFTNALVLFVFLWVFEIPWYATLVLIPCAFITFLLSFVIGHFLAEPLRLLVNKVKAYRSGVPVRFESDGRLHEADELSDALDSLVKKLESQSADLARESKRQSEFVSDVAHELRTPLTAIRGNAEMLQDPDLPPTLREKFTAIIVSESERLTRLVNDLLTLQRVENENSPAN